MAQRQSIFVIPRKRYGFDSRCRPILKKNNPMKNLESKVVDCILEISNDTIIIAGEEYIIPTPTPATLILVSEFISQMPLADSGNTEKIVYKVLGEAKDLSIIGKIAATLVLGAKRIKERNYKTITNTEETKRWSWKKLRHVTDKTITSTKILEIDYLADKILHELSNADLYNLISDRLNNSQISDFFVLTTSLSEANMLRRTKEVETASGE